MRMKNALLLGSLLLMASGSLSVWAAPAGSEWLQIGDQGKIGLNTPYRDARGRPVHASLVRIATDEQGRSQMSSVSSGDLSEEIAGSDSVDSMITLGIGFKNPFGASVTIGWLFANNRCSGQDHPEDCWGYKGFGPYVETELGIGGIAGKIGVQSKEVMMFFPVASWSLTANLLYTWHQVQWLEQDWLGRQEGQTFAGLEGSFQLFFARASAGIYRRLKGEDEDHGDWLATAGLALTW